MTAIHAFLEPLTPVPMESSADQPPKASAAEALREAAYREGYEQGVVEGSRRRALETGDALAKLQVDIDVLIAETQGGELRAAAAAIALTRDIFEKILPEACKRGFATEALPLIEALLAEIPGPELTITAPAPAVESLSKALSQHADSKKLKIEEAGDEAAAAVLSWPDGSADIDLNRMSLEILAVLDRLIAETRQEIEQEQS